MMLYIWIPLGEHSIIVYVIFNVGVIQFSIYIYILRLSGLYQKMTHYYYSCFLHRLGFNDMYAISEVLYVICCISQFDQVAINSPPYTI